MGVVYRATNVALTTAHLIHYRYVRPTPFPPAGRNAGERDTALGVLAAISITCWVALVQHLSPDAFAVHVSGWSAGRLYLPLGYWNATGAFAAYTTPVTVVSPDPVTVTGCDNPRCWKKLIPWYVPEVGAVSDTRPRVSIRIGPDGYVPLVEL